VADAPDPMEELLDEFLRLHRLVAGKIEPGQGEAGGRRPQPASRPPLQLDPVSEMASSEQSIRYHMNQYRRILHRVKRIDITTRTGYTCPHCTTGKLVGWVRDIDPEDHDRRIQPDEVVCLNWQADEHKPVPHGEGYPYRWTADEWRRLGFQARALDDQRYGARPPGVASA
jgi:hypothetical protein